jgi:hypothetical protein
MRKSSRKQFGTDWNRLRSLNDTQLRAALDADPEVQPTDSAFWKGAKVILPHPRTP